MSVQKMRALELQPIDFAEACAFVARFHLHHLPPQGHKFSLAVNDGKEIVGVAIVGRPVNRTLDDTWTLEVTRCCTTGKTKNAASMLYAASWRAARAMGYRRIITYTLIDETGTSLVAAGWKILYQTSGGTWNRKRRPRVDRHPLGQKLLWEQREED